MSGFSFTKPLGNDNGTMWKIYRNSLESLVDNLTNLTEKFDNLEEVRDSSALQNIVLRIKNYTFLLENKIDKFFNDNEKYITYAIQGKDFIQGMQQVVNVIPAENAKPNVNDITAVLNPLKDLVQMYDTIYRIAENEKKY